MSLAPSPAPSGQIISPTQRTGDGAFLGVLRWEEQGCPRGLRQLEELAGNSTNPETYSFPVRFECVPGANLQSVVLSPDTRVLHAMIDVAGQLIDQGAKAITTSCGFNAIFQKELSRALSVPVLTSSLLQIPLIRSILGESSPIAVITAHGDSLTSRHFESVGVTNLSGIHVAGLEQNREWRKIFESPTEPIDIDQFRQDLVELAVSLTTHQKSKAILLECTDLPPFAAEIRQATQTPVYDFVSLINFAQETTGVAAQ